MAYICKASHLLQYGLCFQHGLTLHHQPALCPVQLMRSRAQTSNTCARMSTPTVMMGEQAGSGGHGLCGSASITLYKRLWLSAAIADVQA
jgi:hypothetical protein